MINNYTNYKDSDALAQWLYKKFKNLDEQEFKQSKEDILNDPRLGTTREEREATLAAECRKTMVYNAASLTYICIKAF